MGLAELAAVERKLSTARLALRHLLLRQPQALSLRTVGARFAQCVS